MKNVFKTIQQTSYIFLLSYVLWACGGGVSQKEYKPLEEVYPGLFEQVQLAAVFPDSKTFVDCVPKYAVEDIMKAYNDRKDKANFDLKAFVLEFFDLPQKHDSGYQTDTTLNAQEHINELWSVLTRDPGEDGGTLIPLRKSYVVPGGRFGEIYYWDSYFTMLGLKESGKDTLIANMVGNFAQLIQDFGHIPNGNRSYYLSRSQPPFFSYMVDLLAEMKNDEQIYVEFLPQMQKEYQYWMSAADKIESAKQDSVKSAKGKAFKKVIFIEKDHLLNRYCDEGNTPRPEAYKEDVETAKRAGGDAQVIYKHLRSGAESGWDYSSRWLKDGKTLASIHTTDIAPVDLNALLYHLEETLEKAYLIKGQKEYAASFHTLKQKRKALFDTYFWNQEKGFYYDYDFVEGKQTEVASLAAVYPLFVGLATPEQAAKVAEKLEKEFLMAGGLSSTLVNTGQQWDAPNGWAPLQWMAIKGLRNYGNVDLANEIKNRWVSQNLRVYKNTGKMVEKYNVYDISLLAGGGEYPVQDGFGWTNGVLMKLLNEKL